MEEVIEKRRNLVREDVCPECGSDRLEKDPVRGELVCMDCGLVINENMIDQGQDWRAYSPDEWRTQARTGPPTTYLVHDKGLSTDISSSNLDAQHKPISLKTKQEFYRMRLLHNRVRAGIPGGRGMMEALVELDRMASALGLPNSFKEEAAMLYRKAREKGLVQGRSIRSVMAGVIYAVCRTFDVPRTFDEVARAARVKKKKLKRAYNAISRALKVNLPVTHPEDYLARFTSFLGLPQNVKSRALNILRDIPEIDVVSGKSPLGTVAAAIYLASILEDEPITQRKVSEVVGISEVTLRARCKEIEEFLGH